MPEREHNAYLLLQQFRTFYAEIVRLRRIATAEPDDEAVPSMLAEAGSPAQAPGAQLGSAAEAAISSDSSLATAAPAEKVDQITLRVWNEIAHYLDQKMHEANLAANSISHDYQREMVYIMAAFADETFVCLLNWRGKEFWRDHLMELRLFRSQVSGQLIFQRIDNVLTRQDQGAEELAAVYLMMLALGFLGQYLYTPGAVEVYRNKLFDRLLMTNPALQSDSNRLFPEAYRYTVAEGVPVKLPEPRKWWLLVAGIVSVWLIVSTAAWLWITRPTQNALAVTVLSLDRILSRHSVNESAIKWRSLPFQLKWNAFGLELPATLPLNKGSGSGGPVLAPLYIAVSGPTGSGQNVAAELRGWLSQGKTNWTAKATSNSRDIASVTQIQTPPSGITIDSTTKFFLLDVNLTEQELDLHPQLLLPVNGTYGSVVTAVTLYVSEQTTAGAP